MGTMTIRISFTDYPILAENTRGSLASPAGLAKETEKRKCFADMLDFPSPL
jgi:hypothetical protein